MKIYATLLLLMLFGLNITIAQKFSEESTAACVHPEEAPPALVSIQDNQNLPRLRRPGSVKGSPYLANDYMSFTYVTWAGDKRVRKMKYNMLGHNFEVQTDGLPELIPGDDINEFEYSLEGSDMQRFVNTKVFKSPKLPKGFFKVMMEDKVSLYRLEKITLKELPRNDEDDGFRAAYKYETDLTYYLLVGDEFLAINSFNKKGLAVFGNNTSQVRSFIKKNRLKFKNESDLYKLAVYYQSLR